MAEGKDQLKKPTLWSPRKPDLQGTYDAVMWNQRIGVISIASSYQKEIHAQENENDIKIKKLEALLDEKNSYLGKYKNPAQTAKEEEVAKTKTTVSFTLF